MDTQVYISDLIQEIENTPDYRIVHFSSADVIFNDNTGTHYVIHSHNGLYCEVIQYDSTENYIDHIGDYIEEDITYKAALTKVLKSIKDIES